MLSSQVETDDKVKVVVLPCEAGWLAELIVILVRLNEHIDFAINKTLLVTCQAKPPSI